MLLRHQGSYNMNAPDNEMLNFIREWLWGPILGLIAWAWKWNHDEHQALWSATQSAKDAAVKSSSALNDRIMEHVDSRIVETLRVMREEDARLMVEMTTQRGHIGKLFDKLEEHARRSEDRHIEMMQNQQMIIQTIHTGLASKADK